MNTNQVEETSLEKFISAHVIPKDSNLELTHTELGKIVKRRISIPNEEYDLFMRLYYKDVIKPNRKHNIVERQRIHKNQNSGIFLLDIDLQFLATHTERQYNVNHINDIVDIVLKLFSDNFEIDEDNNFIVSVHEKPSPRLITKPNSSNYMKDGIHLIFSVSIDSFYHQYFRSKIIEKIKENENWSSMQIINDKGWENVFDSAISNGSNGWLAPFSMKPDDQYAYNVTYAYNVNFDIDRDEWNKTSLINNATQVNSFYAQYSKNLFIRNTALPTLSLQKESAVEEYEKFRDNFLNKNRSGSSQKLIQPPSSMDGDDIYQISINTIRQIRSKDDLDLLKNLFLDHVPTEKYDMKEAYEYAMTLPECYYGAGSYNQWIKVGFALRNTSIYLLIAWAVFSAQSSSFDYGRDIDIICDHWMRWNYELEGGVTKLSLMYWSKTDAPEGYQKVHENSIDFYLEMCLDNICLEQATQGGKMKGRGTDWDIARVVYHLKKGYFKACGKEWFAFNGTYWVTDEEGIRLRNLLSTELRILYLKKSKALLTRANQIRTPEGDIDVENEEHVMLKTRVSILQSIATRCANTPDKRNIITECQEHFYDRDFKKNIDQNRYLLCFENGVIDFKERRFRKGYPEDYITKSTKMDYTPLDSVKNKKHIDEIHDYMNKLFPIEELCEYMWKHMASILIGDTAKTQCLHYYTGIGQNGKSMLITLLEMILGEYATQLPVSFYVQERQGIGKATPELMALMGCRLAITSEPSEGEKLNEGPMKLLTSGTDKLTCRGLFKEQQSFVPQTHCVIMANHYLPVKARDHGTWRRIRSVKFLSLFTDNPVADDPNKPFQFKKEESFDEKFKEWAPILMAMLVEKAYEMQGSLPICKIVEDYSNEYRREQDFIMEFIKQKLVSAPGQILRKTQLTSSFNQWYYETYQSKVLGKNQELYTAVEKAFGKMKNNRWTDIRIERQIEDTMEINHNNNKKEGDTDSDITDASTVAES